MMTCKYCAADDAGLLSLMVPVADLGISRVYLLRDQTHPGRCVVVLNEHRTELFHLDAAQRHRFMDDVARVAEVIAALTACRKMNCGMYGDIADHLHVHLVPKTPERPNWGQAFPLGNEQPIHVSDQALNQLAGEIRARCEAHRLRWPRDGVE